LKHQVNCTYTPPDSISFSGGNFWGTIPTTIGLLTNLQYVRIGDSQITGTIPTELGNCPKLHKLSFEISQLSGTLPLEFAFLGFLGKHTGVSVNICWQSLHKLMLD
jgi:hypothetical protein